MNCSQARGLIAAFVDGELDPMSASGLEQHLARCDACRAENAAQLALRKAVREHAPYHRAPDALKAQLSGALRQERAAAAPRRMHLRWDWGLAFASGAAFAVLGLLYRAPAGSAPEQELVAAHVRSLMGAHLFDVASSDQHTVKPWFAGKLDFSPPVRDLAPRDFPLVGGRLDYLDKHPVAALVYRHHSHIINLFVWPSSGLADSQPSPGALSGYSLVRWTRAGMSFWAVSDLNAQELGEFARLQMEPDSPGPR